MSGYTLSQLELLYALTNPVTKNTYTTEACMSATTATIARCIIPANYFSIQGKAIKFRAQGTIAASASTTFTFAVGLDTAAGTIAGAGGLVVVRTASTSVGVLTMPFNIEGDITAENPGSASCLIQCNGVVQVHTTVSGGFEKNPLSDGRAAGGAAWYSTSGTINNESQLFLELFGAWQASAAGNTTVLQQFKVYGEN